MQILHEGRYHRRLSDLSRTACGERYHSEFAPPRAEVLIHPLCWLCFTAFELGQAELEARRPLTKPV